MREGVDVARCTKLGARAVVFLASPAASGVTGANLVVDGGFTKRVAF